MSPNNICPKCSHELKFGIEKIIQTSERGLCGIFHKVCYDEVKLEKIASELS